MPELSNLLRQRLSAQEGTVRDHPDADTLTAFSEQLLPASERQQVLAHLSACADCREVLALSQPEFAEAATQPVFAPAPIPVWRRLFKPAFGFAGAVAATAVIAILVLQNPHQTNQSQSNPEAKVSPLPSPAVEDRQSSNPQTTAGNTSGTSQPEAARSFAEGQGDLANQNRARAERSASAATIPVQPRGSIVRARAAGPAAVQPSLTAGLQKQDYLNNAFFETGSPDVVLNQNAMPSAPAQRSLASEAKLTANSGQIASFYDIPANTSNKSSMRLLTPPPPQEHFGLNLSKIVIAGAHSVFHARVAAPAIRSNSLVTSAMSRDASAELQKDQMAETAAAPGNTQSGALGNYALSAPSFASAASSVALWKIAGGKLFRSAGPEWEEAYPGASFQFTVVNAHGNEVWAGGSQTSLIYSHNGGKTWQTAKLGDAASGAIVSIVFLGTNVQVKTSDDQLWSSSDGGKTWAQSNAQ